MICIFTLVLYRVMRMRRKAGGHDGSPRTALDLFSRIQKNTTHIGGHTFNGNSKTTPQQLDLFDALNLPRPTKKSDVITHAILVSSISIIYAINCRTCGDAFHANWPPQMDHRKRDIHHTEGTGCTQLRAKLEPRKQAFSGRSRDARHARISDSPTQVGTCSAKMMH